MNDILQEITKHVEAAEWCNFAIVSKRTWNLFLLELGKNRAHIVFDESPIKNICTTLIIYDDVLTKLNPRSLTWVSTIKTDSTLMDGTEVKKLFVPHIPLLRKLVVVGMVVVNDISSMNIKYLWAYGYRNENLPSNLLSLVLEKDSECRSFSNQKYIQMISYSDSYLDLDPCGIVIVKSDYDYITHKTIERLKTIVKRKLVLMLHDFRRWVGYDLSGFKSIEIVGSRRPGYNELVEQLKTEYTVHYHNKGMGLHIFS